MSEMIQVTKAMAVTALIVIILQVKMGSLTLEEQTMSFIQTSQLVQPLHEVAQGGVIVLREGLKKISSLFHQKFQRAVDSNNIPGQRSLGIDLKRSQTYVKEQAAHLKARVQESLPELPERDIEAEILEESEPRPEW